MAALLLAIAPAAKAGERSSPCTGLSASSVLVSPAAPWTGVALRVAVAADGPLEGELSLIAPDGHVATTTRERHGGPPYSWFAEAGAPTAGTWHVVFQPDPGTGSVQCAKVESQIAVRRSASASVQGTATNVWPLRGGWTRETENLYSIWIEKLFDAAPGEAPSWPALHVVLRDPSRNFLFNHLGLREDEKGLVIRPDCADLPYFLRAYFAFKLGLPFGYSNCSRGGGGSAPKCAQWSSIASRESESEAGPAPKKDKKSSGLFAIFEGVSEAAPKTAPQPEGLLQRFGHYVQDTLANAVHSGNGRTQAGDDKTDYYPVPLTETSMRPGTIYADPYGHVLVLVKRAAQTPDSAGVLYAVDGQPDGTVARKRFWRGNFLFAQDPSLGSPGFKRFRPIAREKGGTLKRLTNAEITKDPHYGDFSLEQSKLGIEDFYDRMDDVLSPAPLDPERAFKEAIAALEEQVKTRVTSVENGRKYQTGGGKEVTIPDGASIFETTGAWEDFSTPSRDLRLLIAIDVVRGFPDRVARRPERYAMPKDKSAADVRAALESVLATELDTRKFSYTRTDGSQWTLALKDVVDRSPELEMAYNVNDCVELRWGANDKSEEAATCKRRAPVAQRAKMAEYRAWFHERRRPPRG